MPAFDDLRAGRAEPEDEATIGDGVEAGGGHRGERRCTGVDGEDAGCELGSLGVGGEVAEDADGVEAVQLGHPQHVDARRFEICGLLGGVSGVTAVGQGHGQLHGALLWARWRRVRR